MAKPDTRTVVGDCVTVDKAGTALRVRVHYVDDKCVEGTVQRSKGKWRSGEYVRAERADIRRQSDYRARVAEADMTSELRTDAQSITGNSLIDRCLT